MESLLPFLQGFFLPYNTSVYPGALRLAGYSGPTVQLPEGDVFDTHLKLGECTGDYALIEYSQGIVD